MKHTFSDDEARFASIEAMLELLGSQRTRTQCLTLKRAVELAWELRERPTNSPDPLLVAAQLHHMRVDVPTLVAALLGSDVAEAVYSADFLREQFGQEIAGLTTEVRWLNRVSMRSVTTAGFGRRDQAETLRRMLLSMVEDIRVVLVKLAARTQRLHALAKSDRPEREAIARETLLIYAPLANRLGLGQLKWELEDLAFRIVEPDTYKRIAKALEENRKDRERYVRDFVAVLTERLEAHGLKASVFGRPKHIYSIWRKMQAKRVEFGELFDVRAVRVLVDDVQQCYAGLGIAHGLWQPITREFDDYIANPKANGYRSLHTAVIGPAGKPVEIQIRTRQMDHDAENGLAAHWAYKEGSPIDEKLQDSIVALRHLLDDSDDEQFVEGLSQQLDSKRVYVFTPKGEVIDLVAGATPLDFAYHVHSEIGHRCRGAKVNGSIVPLTHTLQNGDRVEVLTTREAAPSRDWLNRSLGFLHSGRARSKVRAWFNARDQAQHLADGKVILERELRRLRATDLPDKAILKRLKYDNIGDLHVAIGRNDISVQQIAATVEHLQAPAAKPALLERPLTPYSPDAGDVRVRGVGRLLTTLAACCRPVPEDAIVGFITRGKGVTVHRIDCSNMLNLTDTERERLIEVSWGEEQTGRYAVEIRIEAYDRVGLLRDVSTIVAAHDADVTAVNTKSDPEEQTADMRLSLQVGNMRELADLMERIRQLRNVQSVERSR